MDERFLPDERIDPTTRSYAASELVLYLREYTHRRTWFVRGSWFYLIVAGGSAASLLLEPVFKILPQRGNLAAAVSLAFFSGIALVGCAVFLRWIERNRPIVERMAADASIRNPLPSGRKLVILVMISAVVAGLYGLLQLWLLMAAAG